MTGVYQSMDIVFPGRVILGTIGTRKIVQGLIVLGRPILMMLCVGVLDVGGGAGAGRGIAHSGQHRPR